MAWDMHLTSTHSQPDVNHEQRAKADMGCGPLPQPVWPGYGSWFQGTWQEDNMGGARDTRNQEISGQEPVLGRKWEGRLNVSWSSKLQAHTPLSYELQSTKLKIKLLRISHSTALNISQAGGPHPTALVTCPWSWPWFWVILNLRWRSSVLLQPCLLLLHWPQLHPN